MLRYLRKKVWKKQKKAREPTSVSSEDTTSIVDAYTVSCMGNVDQRAHYKWIIHYGMPLTLIEYKREFATFIDKQILMYYKTVSLPESHACNLHRVKDQLVSCNVSQSKMLSFS